MTSWPPPKPTGWLSFAITLAVAVAAAVLSAQSVARSEAEDVASPIRVKLDMIHSEVRYIRARLDKQHP